MSEYRCFFADRDAGPCSGALVRAHLLPRQLLRYGPLTPPAVLDQIGRAA